VASAVTNENKLLNNVDNRFVNRSEDFPDIEFHFVSGSVASDGGRQVRKVQGLSDRLWQVYRPLAFKDTW